MQYSDEIVKQYRENGKAITDVYDLIPGMTVWANNQCEPLTILTLCSKSRISQSDMNAVPSIIGDPDPVQWIWFTDGTCISLHDHNVGASYNPWMLFRDEETMLEYKSRIDPTISYGNSDVWDHEWDWDHEWNWDDCDSDV